MSAGKTVLLFLRALKYTFPFTTLLNSAKVMVKYGTGGLGCLALFRNVKPDINTMQSEEVMVP